MSPRGPRSSLSSGDAPTEFDPAEASPNYLHVGDRKIPLVWDEIFETARPVELEIGCGNGRFVALEAARRPETNFWALERNLKYALLAASRVSKKDLANARVSCAEAGDALVRLISPASLAATHVYFSDPWPKRRHARRRLFQRPFLDAVARAVEPGGALRIRTDVDWYFADIVSLVIEHPEFEITQYGQQLEFPEDELEMTGFESKALRSDRNVYYVYASRRRDGAK